jgi:hypothetical protein
MGLRPTQGDEKRLGPATTFLVIATLSFVIPSEAEGSAVPRTSPGNVFSTERTRISCTLHWKRPRVRLSSKESRMKFDNATGTPA